MTLTLGLLVALAHLMLLIAALMKLTNLGPVLFSRERIGFAGRYFPCLKFRSTATNSAVLL